MVCPSVTGFELVASGVADSPRLTCVLVSLIDSIERFRSYWEVHPGAVYSNAAEQFIVLDLDLDRKLATVRPTKKINYYTSVQDHVDVNVLTRLAQWQSSSPSTAQHAQRRGDAPIYWGRVEVITKVWGYRKHHVKTQRIFDTMPLVLPPIAYTSVGFWIDLKPLIF